MLSLGELSHTVTEETVPICHCGAKAGGGGGVILFFLGARDRTGVLLDELPPSIFPGKGWGKHLFQLAQQEGPGRYFRGLKARATQAQ